MALPDDFDMWTLEQLIGDYFDNSPTRCKEWLERTLAEVNDLINLLEESRDG